MLLSLLDLKAQDSISVRFFIKGGDEFYIKANNEILPLSNIQKFVKGTYDIEIFSPTYLIHTGILEVKEDSEAVYFAILETDPEFKTFLKGREKYKRKVFALRTLPVLIGGAGLVTSSLFFIKSKSTHQNFVIESFKAENEISTGGSLNDLEKQYLLDRNLIYASAGVAFVGLTTFLILNKKSQSIKRPVYRQKNPFTLEYFDMTFNRQFNTPQAGLHFTF